MPTYKVRCTDGTERDLQAQRVALTDEHTRFERRAGAQWVTLLELPSESVSEVRRRVIEGNGTFRWVPAQPVRRSGPQ